MSALFYLLRAIVAIAVLLIAMYHAWCGDKQLAMYYAVLYLVSKPESLKE